MTLNLTFVPVNTFSMQFAGSLHFTEQAYGDCFYYIFLTSLCIAPVLGWLVDKLHPLRMVMGTLTAYILVTVWGGIFATDKHNFITATCLHGVISECYYTSVASLGNRLFPRSRYAQFASAAGIRGSLTGIVFAPVTGMLIDRTGHMFRISYFIGCAFSIIALLLALAVYARFKQYGGLRNYVAPE